MPVNGVKRIGLIGGLSPESTVHYYEYLCREFNRRRGGLNFPEIAMQSLNLQRLIGLFEVNDWNGVATILLDALRRLESAGAEFAAILANTPHNAYDRIREASPLPILTIMDATCDALTRDDRQRVALLGTRATMEFGRFQDHFRKEGIETLVPEQSQRLELDRIIWEELAHGKVTSDSKQVAATMIEQLVDTGAQAIILGCTELSMLIVAEDSSRPLYDTTLLHAEAILNHAIQA